MKTNTNTKEKRQGRQNRTEQSSTTGLSEKQRKERAALMEARRKNRESRLETVLQSLQTSLPGQYEQAEIVGRWIWLDCPKDDRRAVTHTLLHLGFHWNQRRAVWQHPCGNFAPYEPHPGDPREKYGSQFVNQ